MARGRGRGRGGSDDYWVSKRPEGDWALQREGAKRASGLFDRQGDAIRRGKALAKKARSELIVKNGEGRIRSKDSFGNDPPSRKDTEH